MNSISKDVSYNKEFETEFRNLIYSPLKTIRECNNWAKQSLKIPHVNYEKFHVDIANRINRQLQIMIHLYPEVNSIKWIDDMYNSAIMYLKSSNYINEHLKSKNISKKMYLEELNNLISFTTDEDCKFKGIWLNDTILRTSDEFEKEMDKSIKSQFSPEGTNGIEANITHEFAHHMEVYLRKQKAFGYMNNIWKQNHLKIKSRKKREIKSCKSITKKLCKYASTSISEFFAAAISEYIHNPNPRPLAKYIGEKTDEVFKELRMKNKK